MQHPPSPLNHRCSLRLAAVCVATLLMCSCQSLTGPQSSASKLRRATGNPMLSEPHAKPHGKPPAPVRMNVASESVIQPVTWLDPSATVPSELPAAPMMTSAPCQICSPQGAVGLPPAAFGGDWSGEFVRPPFEEYVCNGGDQNVEVQVKQDWTVQGLHSGDTVVHYDTVDGKTLVEPSNEVCLYAPRFAAVRKVYGVVAHEQHDRVAGIESPVGAELSTDLGQPTTVTQPLQATRRHSITGMQSFLEKSRGIGVDNAQRPAITEEEFLPFEDLAIIRRGVFDNTEKARLAARLQAAIAWSHNQAPQVLLDNETAVVAIGTNGTESVYTYELPTGKSRLRVVKIASKQNAKPGELVEFTLRFDNVGDQTIGNITVIDRLHDRLEYVPESQSCSLAADFLTEDEDGSPRVLRWEIGAPMKVGTGGLIRFTCRVR
jgi:uncharacterized repeat protein (TIGR01451 family)